MLRTGGDAAALAGGWGPELCAIYPLVWLGLVHQMAWLASVHLGHWPRPSFDDPKGLPWPLPWLQILVLLALCAWPSALVLGLGGVSVRLSRRRWIGAASGLLALLLAHWLVFELAAWDPAGTLDWLMD
ncbi:MAG: hypothetical protein KIT58_08565 [Planctomycetota bacterium]|nr:hypothetical protein [Planctomycetota bacterium]